VVEDLALRCTGLSKRFGDAVALDGFDLEVERGVIMAVLGPSGCGKTTALRMIAGFETPDDGEIEIDGRIVAGKGVNLPPEKRRAGMVFQDYALFPHLNVRRNIAYGLAKGRGKERLRELVELVGLQGLEERLPHELSGGQQQRVALARTLASEPSVLLLDEPFSNLDVKLRAQVRQDVRRVIQAAGTTAVFVTHDQDEAFVLADTVAVMNRGRVEQVGTPEQLYYEPATRFVAAFVGLANFLPAVRVDGRIECEVGSFNATDEPDGDLELLLRPDDIAVGEGAVEATIESREFLGHDLLYVLRLASGQHLQTIQSADLSLQAGSRVRLAVKRERPVVFPRPSA
jgi:iron(III) transport system ATP-binding protein